MVEAVFHDAPEMIAVAKCESNFVHYLPSGGVIEGKTKDHGVMQINAPAHQKRMEQLGLDINDLYDNLTYARKLYDESGSRPWVCARKVAIR